MYTTKRFVAALAALTLLCAPAAQATLVTQWDYALLTRFSGVNTFQRGYPTQIETETQVSWGAPGGNVFTPGGTRSGITLADLDTTPGGDDPEADPIAGIVVTNGTGLSEIGLGAWITHHNNPVSPSYASLLTSEIESTLTLFPNTPPLGGQVGPSMLSFTIHFAETTNLVPCVAASPAGNPCNDIFAIDASEAFNQLFEFDGLTYSVDIFPLLGDGTAGFPFLSDAECATAGAGAGCVGFTTVEGQDTTIRFGFSVSAPVGDLQQSVPEPGSTALVALALASAALAFRRRAM